MVTEVPPKETTMTAEEPRVQDAAMSLCALGRPSSASPDPAKSCSDEPSSAAPAGDGSATDPASPANPTAMNLELDDRLKISDAQVPPSESTAKPAVGKKAAPKKARPSAVAKHSVKPKDPKRDTSVPFDEMKRLMRVYGSLKCLRNRTPVDSGRTAKMESVKRKFYRWFPDLEERFVRTAEGWYQPKAGHEEEMRYRESMRKEDQENLVKKRNSKRSSTKRTAAPPV